MLRTCLLLASVGWLLGCSPQKELPAVKTNDVAQAAPTSADSTPAEPSPEAGRQEDSPDGEPTEAERAYSKRDLLKEADSAPENSAPVPSNSGNAELTLDDVAALGACIQTCVPELSQVVVSTGAAPVPEADIAAMCKPSCDACISDCVAARAMQAVAAEQIDADCQKHCAELAPWRQN
ncbi:MAG: hypothetical protein RBU37_24115 [Myxococcota bacterium]|nr:hypothetical protein [Myxococcota bacterium]